MWDEIERRIAQAGSWSPVLDACPEDAGVRLEHGRLEAGEPWCVATLAGLQFYRYDQPGLDEAPLRPEPGERLNLVRRPDNPHDANAVEVWLRNEHMLGHVARGLAARIAPELDRGVPLRCYALGPGTGGAWSVRAMFVGRPVAEDHGLWLDAQVRDAEWARYLAEGRIEDPHKARGAAFRDRLARARTDRLTQAVRAFEALPVPPELVPPAGEEHAVKHLAASLGMSKGLLVRLVKQNRVTVRQHKRGWFTASPPTVVVTPELRAALVAWCARPTAKACPGALAAAVNRRPP